MQKIEGTSRMLFACAFATCAYGLQSAVWTGSNLSISFPDFREFDMHGDTISAISSRGMGVAVDPLGSLIDTANAPLSEGVVGTEIVLQSGNFALSLEVVPSPGSGRPLGPGATALRRRR